MTIRSPSTQIVPLRLAEAASSWSREAVAIIWSVRASYRLALVAPGVSGLLIVCGSPSGASGHSPSSPGPRETESLGSAIGVKSTPEFSPSGSGVTAIFALLLRMDSSLACPLQGDDAISTFQFALAASSALRNWLRTFWIACSGPCPAGTETVSECLAPEGWVNETWYWRPAPLGLLALISSSMASPLHGDAAAAFGADIDWVALTNRPESNLGLPWAKWSAKCLATESLSPG